MKLRKRTAYIGNLVAIQKRNNHTKRLWGATIQHENVSIHAKGVNRTDTTVRGLKCEQTQLFRFKT